MTFVCNTHAVGASL